MSGILALGIQDFKRLLSNALFWVITVTLVLIIALINFALPQSTTQSQYRIFAYHTAISNGQVVTVESEKELRQAVQKGEAIGLLGQEDGSLTVLNPGLSQKTVRAVMTMLLGTPDTSVLVESIDPDSEIIPFNKRMTPVFICFEALIIGFILGGALMLTEKESGVIRALRIAPMGVDRYLVSKTVLFSIIAVIYALLMALLCIGVHFSILQFIALSFFGAAIFSLMGLAFTAFFKDMSSWFFSMALLLSINMLPVVAYMEPSFSPLWMRAIPSYTMIFAYEKILFGGGVSLGAAATVAAWCTAMYLISRVIVGRLLLAKGR